jgi:hypothetical protein
MTKTEQWSSLRSIWSELSLVSRGAFDAPIQQVAASTPEEEEDTTIQEEPQQETQPMNETVEAPAVIEASKATQTIFATAKREFKMPTPGEYISAFVTNPDKFAEMRAGIEAAAPDVLTGDIPGMLPLCRLFSRPTTILSVVVLSLMLSERKRCHKAAKFSSVQK